MSIEERKLKVAERKARVAETKDAMINMIRSKRHLLLPCPFCGDNAIIKTVDLDTLNPSIYIGCDCFGTTSCYDRSAGNIQTPYYRNFDLAIEKWNYRAKPMPKEQSV